MANLVTKMENKKGNTTLSSYAYSYNFDGNQRSKTDHTGRTDSYTYDNMGRLTSETVKSSLLSADEVTSYKYDYRGNRIQKDTNSAVTNYTYDSNNRLLKQVTSDKNSSLKNISEYKYDKNGNMKSKANSLSGVNPTKTRGTLDILTASEYFAMQTPEDKYENYQYDVFNQLVGYKCDNNKTYSTYTYMPNGLRASKSVKGTKSIQIWEGQNLAFETNTDGEVSNLYDYGVDLIRNAKSDSYYVYNSHGDVTQMTNSSGKVTYDYTYDAFGVTPKNNAGDTNTIRYCGEFMDSETGFMYLRNRYYDPSIGRFINEDPARDGLNWYSYCSGTPILGVDPSGLDWKTEKIDGLFNGAKKLLNKSKSFADEKQKEAQRKFWAGGSKIILRDYLQYETSAWLLEHSLQDNPEDVIRGNDSRIAGLINNDKTYLSKLDEVLKATEGNTVSENLKDVVFSTGDLYYSIHRSSIHIEGKKNDNGVWSINATLEDTYDFTEIQSFMDENGKGSTKVGLGTLANDLAVVSQKTGAINSYKIKVEFKTERKV